MLLEECGKGGWGVGVGRRGRGGCTDRDGAWGRAVSPMSISSTAAGCDASSATYESSFKRSKWRRRREGACGGRRWGRDLLVHKVCPPVKQQPPTSALIHKHLIHSRVIEKIIRVTPTG